MINTNIFIKIIDSEMRKYLAQAYALKKINSNTIYDVESQLIFWLKGIDKQCHEVS